MPTDRQGPALDAALDQIEARLRALEEENRRLTEQLHARQAPITTRAVAVTRGEPSATDDATGVSRRRMLRGAATAAAGGAAVVASGALARPAAAANGQGVILGTSNSETSTTVITGAVASNAVLTVSNTSATSSSGVIGFAGPATGIGIPAGVVGDSTTRHGVSGTSTYTGPGGASGVIGVYGGATGLVTKGAGVTGDGYGGPGVSGTAGNGHPGVYGAGYLGGRFEIPATLSSGLALSAGGTGSGFIPLHLDPSTAAVPPIGGQAGDIWLGADHQAWLCVTDSALPVAVAVWRKIGLKAAGFDAAGGTTNLLPSPFRLYDSSGGTASIKGTGTVKPGTASAVHVQVTGTAPPAGTTSVAIPAGAVGVIGTVTAFGTTGSGYLVAHPDGTAAPLVATTIWIGANTVAPTSFTAGLSADGKLQITNGAFGSSTATHVAIDVVGFIQ